MSSRTSEKNRIRQACLELESALNQFQTQKADERFVSEQERLKELRRTLLRIKEQLGVFSA